MPVHQSAYHGELAVVYHEVRKAVGLVSSINTCDEASCETCSIMRELLADVEMRKYIDSQKYKDCILPVDTAMCDNFVGWGNFAENVLGITANICHAHATGNVQDFPCFDCS